MSFNRGIIVFISVFAMFVFSMVAAHFDWSYIPSFISVEKVIPLGNKVYFTSCGNLFSHNKSNGETNLETIPEQTGSVVSIYSDLTDSQLAVACKNGYIYIIEKNGNGFGLSSLSDLELSDENVINNISFDEDNLLVATCTGPVIFDLKSRKIIKSYNMHRPVYSFTSDGQNYLLNFDNSLYKVAKTDDLRDRQKYVRVNDSDYSDSQEETTPINDLQSLNPNAIRVKSADILRFDSNKNLLVATISPYSRFNLIEDKKATTPIDFLYNKIRFDSIAHVSDLVIHPINNQYIFAGSFTDGIVRLKNGKKDFVFDNTNSPLKKDWGCSAQGLGFDKDGNLWVATGYETNPALMMLPADKTLGNSTAVDWFIPDLPPFTFQIDGKLNVVGDVVIVTSSDYRCGLLLYNRSTGKSQHLTSFTDSDLFSFESDYIYKTFADSRGRLWCLTSSGVFYIKDISSFFDSSDTLIVRPKINRDDSTLLADYALNGVDVVDMAEDITGKFYFATRDEGVYLLNNDCSEIINHLYSANSPLTTDNVRSVIADDESVYIGTPSGLFRIDSDTQNSSLNLSDVKIYPNPVKPGYTGLVTIENVSENSLVKIIDTAGNNILSATSSGKKLTINPSQLSAGIYNVLVTTNDGQSKIIGKLMIIR